VHPLVTPSGLVLSREAPDDHPWHHGLWFTIKFVNGENFWEEYDEYGVLRHDGAPTVTGAGDGAVELTGSLRWIRPDRRSVILRERRTFRYQRIADDAYRLEFETQLSPTADVVLDRTPFTTWGGYGGLTLRGDADWVDTRLLLADGTTAQQVHGAPARWCDLSSERGGVSWFDHPDNPRHPTPWYGSTRADTYGEGWANFLNAAFLWDEPMSLAAEEPLVLRYALAVHDGWWDADRIEHVAAEYGA
jgi:hypothetical protein